MEVSSIFIASISAAAVLCSVLVFLLVYLRNNQAGKYDQERHRVELEMMRSSLEKQLYQLTNRLMSTEERWKDLNHLLISRLDKQRETTEPLRSTTPSSFLRSFGLKEQITVDKSLVFVLTPFNDQFQSTFDAIASACRNMGLTCVRGDETRVVGDLFPHIVQLILRSAVIVANIDGRNPNVFYELGIAHALDKITIMITKSIKSAPFDLRTKKLVVYEGLDDLKTKLQLELARTLLTGSHQAPSTI